MHQKEVMDNFFRFLDLDSRHKAKEEKISTEKLELINTTTKGNPLEKWRKLLSEEEIGMVETVKNKFGDEFSFIQEELKKYRIGIS